MRTIAKFKKLTGNYKDYLKIDGYILYCFTNKTNQNLYVGITKNLLKRLQAYTSPSSIKYPIVRAIKKYGFANFNLDVLKILSTLEEACQEEFYWINELRKLDVKMYNICDGGMGVIGSKKYSGIDHANAKFNEIDIQNIFNEYHINKMSAGEISEKNKVNLLTVCKILKGQSYNKTSLPLVHKFGDMRDKKKEAVIKGVRGSKATGSKMDENSIIELFKLYFEENVTKIDLREKFDLTKSSLDKLLRGETWFWFTEPLFNRYKKGVL